MTARRPPSCRTCVFASIDGRGDHCTEPGVVRATWGESMPLRSARAAGQECGPRAMFYVFTIPEELDRRRKEWRGHKMRPALTNDEMQALLADGPCPWMPGIDTAASASPERGSAQR